MIAAVALVGCGKNPAEESVFDQGRPDATKPSKPPAKTEAQIEPEAKAFAEGKAKIVEKEIRRQLKKPTGELTKADLEKVTVLNLNGKQLTFVKGLEKFTQLEYLYLTDNQLTNVKGLEKLTKLEYLDLRFNPALTKAQIDVLQKALPKCKIWSNPTK